MGLHVDSFQNYNAFPALNKDYTFCKDSEPQTHNRDTYSSIEVLNYLLALEKVFTRGAAFQKCKSGVKLGYLEGFSVQAVMHIFSSSLFLIKTGINA